MKKILVSLLLIACFAFVSTGSFAESNTISIVFKVGDDTLKINGKDVKVEKPFVVKGVTLVPLRVITEAFGAEVKWNGQESSITLKYGDKVIKLFIGQKKVLVDGVESTLQEAPKNKKGITMVPLRFITENFGSDIKYDKETKQITVTKEFAGDNSIKDYSMVLKKTTKDMVGDSYFKWSMNLPKGLKISDRNFDGSYTYFEGDDETYGLFISIMPKQDQTLDTLLAEDLKRNTNYTLVSQGKQTKNGIEYTKAVFKGENVIDLRNYIKDNNIFKVVFAAKDYDKYKDTKEYTSIIDSFITDFKDKNSIEDLSDINENGYRTFTEKNLKFSIDVMPEWYQLDNEDQPNTVEFVNSLYLNAEFEESLCVDMYSIEEGATLESWANKMLTRTTEELNPKYYQIIKQEDSTLSGVPCKKIYYTQVIKGETMYSCDILLFGKNYKYNVYYHIADNTFNDKDKFTKLEKALLSFKFTEPDAAKVGQLASQDDIEEVKTKVKKQNTNYKWSFELPASWTAGSDNNDKDLVKYNNGIIFFSMTIIEGDSLEDFVSFIDEGFAKSVKTGTKKIIKKEKTFGKGTEMYQYNCIDTASKVEFNSDSYVLCKNGYIYIIDILCPMFNYSEKNKAVIESLWQSVNIQ